MTPLPRLGALIVLAGLAACAPAPSALPAAPVAAGSSIAVQAVSVPLNPEAPGQTAIGAFVYAGGLQLSSTESSRFHGLSDLVVDAEGRLTAISDEGDLIEGQLLFEDDRLAGVADVTLRPLSGLDGQPLPNKELSDAEGLAILASGDMLVSFERQARVWLYPADGGPPRAVPSPEAEFPLNGGLEALAPDPERGPDAYVVGGEASGETWSCRIATACVPGPRVAKGADFGLVAMRRLPGDQSAYLLRAWDPLRGNRIVLTITGANGEVGRMEMARPLTVDNFEGVDFVPRPGGGYRIYLLADDNFSASQRTLLLAFDWRPAN
ncbi:esterase-like activity of phytase family protein [Phenylobacterium sp.]|uniref:esterase-like activity of phytase family protein n=1 Tax=Phenylobacterium sp. TaxID=1871053 RepID=UPI00273079CF|nr:esterase-like activity of phytase family protein [Phenylobacterium sp.]MDP1617404.1 esterase-like activity of phytase family protein [Phenylobacterium sp.]MDP1988738.1 esterase-like activity of phytase family protein [Phenylobacterium sp.]